MATKKTKTADGATVETPTPATANAAPAAGSAEAKDRMAAARAARNSAQGKDRFIYQKDLEKGAPQAKGIVNILKAAGTQGLTRDELTAKMVGVVQTRQPQSRILGYYQKDLESVGAVKIIKAASEPVAAAMVAAK